VDTGSRPFEKYS